MKIFRLKNRIAVATVIFVLSLLLSFTAFFGIRQDTNNNAEALVSVSGAYQIGEKRDGSQLTEIYDSSLGKFKAEYLDELLEKITGVQNATITNVNSMISSAPVLFGSNLVKAPTINANAGKPNDGIVVKIGGYNWTVTSLVDSGSDAVVTLMLSDVVGTGIRFAATYDSSNWVTTNAPASMYGSSLARQELINPSGLFGNFVSGSMTSYLVKPVDVAYQHTLDVRLLNNFTSMSLQNEGLDNVGEYLPNFNFYGKTGNGNGTGYSDWGNDYIWLPAFAEAAQPNNADFTGGIWSLTRNQYLHSGTVYYSIFRSSMYSGTAINVCGVAADGTLDAWQPNLVGAPHDVGLRPAIHLNLTKAVQDAVYTSPDYTGVETTYNGTAQTLYSLMKITGSNPMTYSPLWYRKGIYDPKGGNTPMSGLSVKFYKGLSADNKGYKGGTACEVTSMTDAGDYEVALTLPSGKQWSGTPDTSRGETDQIRLYKFKIKQKAVTLTMTVSNKGVVTITAPAGAVYTRDGTVSASGFDLEYDVDTGNLAGGKAESWYIDHPDKTKPPEYAGKYKVTLKALGTDDSGTGNSPTNFNPDKYNYNNNYAFSTIPQTKTFTYPKTEVAEPTVSGGTSAMTVDYDGTEHTFTIVYDSDRITLTAPTGLTLANDADGNPKLIKGTRAGEYKVKAALKDSEESQWSTGAAADVREFTLTISPIKLSFTATKANDSETGVPWSWTMGATGNITVRANERILSDDAQTLSYELCYYDAAADPAASGTEFTVLGDFDIKSGSTYFYPECVADITEFSAGSYKLYVRVKSGSTENTDYEIVNSFPFTIQISNASLNLDDLLFKIEQDGAEYTVKVTWSATGYTLSKNGALPTGADVKNNVLELTYSTKAYDFSAVISDNRVSIDTNKTGTNAGYTGSLHATSCSKKSDGTYDTVKITVYLKTSSGAEFGDGSTERSFELVYRLNPIQLDLSKMDWNYKATDASGQPSWPVYSGSSHTLALTGVPSGLTATYGNATKTEPGEYTATVTFSYDSTNYTVKNDDSAADKDTDKTNLAYWKSYTWEIVKIKIDTSVWDDPDKDNSTSDSTVYWAPTLGVPEGGTDHTDKVYYKYYASESVAKSDTDGSLGSDDFEIDETTTEIYYVRVFVKSDASEYYEIDTEHDYVYSFTVGDGKSAVRLKFPKTVVEYDGNAHFLNGELDFVGLSSLSKENDIALKYYEYDAGNATDGYKGAALGAGEKPTAVGKYVVELSLTDPAAENHVLATKTIAVEITAIKLNTEGLKWTVEDEHGNAVAEYDAEQGKWILVKPDAEGNPQHTVLDKNSDPDLYAEIFGYTSKGGLKLTLKGDVYTTQTSSSGQPVAATKTVSEDGKIWTFTREIGGVEEVLFTVELTGELDPESNLNVGTHGVGVTVTAGDSFTGSGAGNIELPEIPSANWEIVKAKIDGSRLAWDYPEDGYAYELGEETNEAGQKLPKARTVRLVMLDENGEIVYEKDENGNPVLDEDGNPIPALPEGLAASATSGYTSSGVGRHTARYDLTVTDANNYEFGSFGEGLNVTKTSGGYYAVLTWDIHALEIPIPEVPEEDVTFSLISAPNLLELLFPDNTFLWENWSDYMTVRVEYTDDIYSADREELEGLTAENAGRYYLQFTILDPDNVSFADGSLEQTVTLDVKPDTITITGWNAGHRPVFDPETVPSDYYELVYTYEEDGEIKTTTVTPTKKNIEYTATVRVKAELEGNVLIVCKDGDETLLTHTFILTDTISQDSKPIKIPTLNETNLTYNGTEQEVTLAPFDADFLEVSVNNGGVASGNKITVTGAGEYTVTVTFKAGRLGHWDSEGSIYHETQVAITYTIVVEKLYIPLSWNDSKRGEPPVIELPAEYANLGITYEYRDPETGKLVAKEALVKGVNYRVTATLKDSENVEFIYTDENGEEKTAASATSDFTIKSSGGWLNDLFGLSEDFPLWQIIVICICLILFIIFMIITAKHRKEKKEADEETKKYEEDMMLNS